jgi:hypothetical protein
MASPPESGARDRTTTRHRSVCTSGRCRRSAANCAGITARSRSATAIKYGRLWSASMHHPALYHYGDRVRRVCRIKRQRARDSGGHRVRELSRVIESPVANCCRVTQPALHLIRDREGARTVHRDGNTDRTQIIRRRRTRTTPASARVRRIEDLVGDSGSRRAAPESRGLRALLFRAISPFRTEPLNSLAVGR